jgi:hypothetical protein
LWFHENLNLIFFLHLKILSENRDESSVKKLPAGSRPAAAGRVRLYRGNFSETNPIFSKFSAASSLLVTFLLTEK